MYNPASAIALNQPYRRCDGAYFIVTCKAVREGKTLIVMTQVGDDTILAVSPEEFFEDVSGSETNYTHQRFRYELAKEFTSILGAIPTEDLVRELQTRHDNPFSEVVPITDDDNVYGVDYMVGRLVTSYDAETDSDIEEFKVYTPVTFDSIEDARKHRDNFYANKPAVIARRVISRVSEY